MSLSVFSCRGVAEAEVFAVEACDKGITADRVGLIAKSELITNTRAFIFSSP